MSEGEPSGTADKIVGLTGDIEGLKRDFRNLSAKTADAVTQEVGEHPLRSLIVALGIGFIGGLFVRR
jgi:ElaB/YqjD/DUF883 family membrane-anchored ribosome-binding protein